jgi:hypothetical protein
VENENYKSIFVASAALQTKEVAVTLDTNASDKNFVVTDIINQTAVPSCKIKESIYYDAASKSNCCFTNKEIENPEGNQI